MLTNLTLQSLRHLANSNDQEVDSPLSMEQRMVSALVEQAVDAQVKQSYLFSAAETASANPGRLLRIQTELAEFQISLQLGSAFARKAATAVETLVKS